MLEENHFLSVLKMHSQVIEKSIFFKKFFLLLQGIEPGTSHATGSLPLSHSSDPNNSICNFKPQFNVLKRKQEEVDIVKSLY